MSDYMERTLRDLVGFADKTIKIIKDSGLEPEVIAVRGNSGVLIGGIVSAMTGIPLMIVRKQDSHGSMIETAKSNFEKYVIVDDGVVSGHTVSTIMRAVQEFEPHAKCVGIVLYNRGYFDEYMKEVNEVRIFG